MKLELTDVGNCRRKMSLVFDAGEVAAALEEGYRGINNQVRIKGFRPGKAPRRTLEKMFAGDAAAAAKKWLIDKNLFKAIKDGELAPVGALTEKNHAETPKPGQPFTVELEMTVEPPFELPPYKGMELEERPIRVEDAEVESAIERFRQIFARHEDAGRPAEPGDIVNVDIRVACGESELKNLQDQRLRIAGDILFDLPCPDLIEKFTGARPGDVVRLILTLPGDHPTPELRGRPAEVEAKVKMVERTVLPELNDSFAGILGAETVEQLRRRTRENLINIALREAVAQQEVEIIDKLTTAAAFAPPAEVTKDHLARLLSQFKSDWERKHEQEPAPGDEALETALEKYRPEAEKEALRAAKWFILVKRIARLENIEATQGDMANHIESLARAYKTSAAIIIRRIREFNGVEAMMEEILSMKVVEMIRINAKSGRLGSGRPAADTGSANAEAAESVNQTPIGAEA
ncbi:MAG: trigger factor [Planctomycetota bacterium]|nr:trigger factor [Planctomycetota bacterium]